MLAGEGLLTGGLFVRHIGVPHAVRFHDIYRT